MNQALHIFRKDVRRLWPQILAVLGFFAAFAFAFAPTLYHVYQSVFMGPLVVCSCWFLGISVMHLEALPGNRQFWLTRPYERSSLLAAKVLFLLTFVFLPFLISGCILEARANVPILNNAGGLLIFELAQSAWIIIPAIAIGAVTNSVKRKTRNAEGRFTFCV